MRDPQITNRRMAHRRTLDFRVIFFVIAACVATTILSVSVSVLMSLYIRDTTQSASGAKEILDLKSQIVDAKNSAVHAQEQIVDFRAVALQLNEQISELKAMREP